jgi:hypothetical protein
MNSTGYKLIGFAVWNGARWYVKRNYLSRLPSARKAGAGVVGALAATGIAVLLARRALD